MPEATTPAPAQVPVGRGLFTTEFSATVASAIGMGLGLIPQQYAPAVAGLVGVYVACRTLLKIVHQMGYAKQLPDLPEFPFRTGSDTKEQP